MTLLSFLKICALEERVAKLHLVCIWRRKKVFLQNHDCASLLSTPFELVESEKKVERCQQAALSMMNQMSFKDVPIVLSIGKINNILLLFHDIPKM